MEPFFAIIADGPAMRQGPTMRRMIILLALASFACSEPVQPPEQGNIAEPELRPVPSPTSVRDEFLSSVGNDSWVDWPPDLSDNPGTYGRACIRVSEQRRAEAVRLLDRQAAVELDEVRYRRLVGEVRPPGGGTPWLLRGFASADSTSLIRRAGDAVVVYTNSRGELLDVRRYPCAAILNAAPTRVFTVAAYDM